MCAIICATRSPFNISAPSIQVSVYFEKFDIKLFFTKRGGHVSLYGLYQQGSVCGDINSALRSGISGPAWLVTHIWYVTMLQVITSSSSPAPVIFPSARGLIEHRTCLFCVFSFYILYIVICIWKLCSYMIYIYWPYLKFQIKMFWYSPVSAGLYSHLPTDSL